LTKKPNLILTEKTKLDLDKKMHNYVLKKKRKKTSSWNTALPPTRRQKPTHEKPSGGGYAAVQTFCTIKKAAVLRLRKRIKI
jgi:hypothetical protein